MRQALHVAPLGGLIRVMTAVLFAVLTIIAAVTSPAPALAANGTYAINELSTQITVETSGTAHVVERQTLAFDDLNRGIVWYLHAAETGESVRISSVRVAPVDDGGTLLGDWTRLQMIDSNPRQQGRNPGDACTPIMRARADEQPWYSYDISDGMVRACFPLDAASGSRTYIVETDYIVAHRIRIFRDAAELYWRYANDSLPCDAENVSLQVRLPLPADADPAAIAERIRAWGHGPDEGTFSVAEDATVTYLIARLAKGNYAEAHIIFPPEWMSDAAAGTANTFNELRWDEAISEEAEWVDLATREAAWDNKVRVLFLIIALTVILLGAIGVVRNGRSPKSRRSLMRASAALGIIALGENLFFREPLTTAMLAALMVVVGVVALALPDKPLAGDSGNARKHAAATRAAHAPAASVPASNSPASHGGKQ